MLALESMTQDREDCVAHVTLSELVNVIVK